MPNRPKNKNKKFSFEAALLDKLLENYKSPEDMFGSDGLLESLKTELVERALQGELTDYLGYDKHSQRPEGCTNARNGSSSKTLKTDTRPITIQIPRDRESSFKPIIVPKYCQRLAGFDEKVIALYARGMSTRDIEGTLSELYGVEVSPSLISAVTDEVTGAVEAWQNRPLDELYPVVYFDALVAHVRDEESSRVVKKAVYIALGINCEGEKEVLGMWIGEAEGAKFWLRIMTELKNRGMKKMYIACVDGLKGFPEAIEVEYPKTCVQLCIVHMVRNNLRYVSYKDRKEVAADLKNIYRSTTAEQARGELAKFREKWDKRFPIIGESWENNWDNLVTFFEFPEEIRRVIYTTNAIESLNHSMRKVLKNKKALVSDKALKKILYLALQKASAKWTRPISNWGGAMLRFKIMFEEKI